MEGEATSSSSIDQRIVKWTTDDGLLCEFGETKRHFSHAARMASRLKVDSRGSPAVHHVHAPNRPASDSLVKMITSEMHQLAPKVLKARFVYPSVWHVCSFAEVTQQLEHLLEH